MREIFETDRFKRQMQTVQADNGRLADALSAAKDILRSRPETFGRVGHEDWYFFRTIPFPGIPALIVYFRFDDEKVYLLRVSECAEEADSDESNQPGMDEDRPIANA